MFRRLFVGTVSRAAFSLVTILISLLLVPFLIGALGKGAYGLVVLLGVFTAQGFGGLADLGLASAVTKYCAQYAAAGDRGNLERLLGTSFWLYAGIACVTGILVWLLGRLALDHVFSVPAEDRVLAGTLLVVLAVGTVVDFTALWLAAVLDGFQRYHVGNAIQIVRVVLSATLVVGVVRAGYGAIGWVVAVVIANALAAGASYLYLRSVTAWSIARARFDRGAIKTLWAFSTQVFITRLTSVAYHTIDRTALGMYAKVDALAVYDVCNKIHSAAVVPLGFTSTLTVPSVSSLDATGRSDDVREFFLRGTLYTVAISLPIVVVLMMLAPYILAAWIGRGFEQYATEARVFLSYVVVWSLTPVGWNLMIGLNRTEKLLPVNLASVALNLVISLSLASRLGVLGVILGTVVGNLLAVPLYVRVFLDGLGISVMQFLRRVILRAYPQGVVVALALGAVLAAYTPRSLLALGVMGAAAGLLYAVLFWFSGVDAIDKQRFGSLLSRGGRSPVL